MADQVRVGMIGAGRMGLPVLRRVVAAGHEVRVLGRTPDRRAALAEDGARPVETVAEVAADAEVVLVSLFTDDQVRAVCLDTDLIPALPTGAILVLHTTGSPRTAQAVAERAAGRGIAVLDAPFSGGPHDIAAGHVTLFVGGPADALDRARPVLDSYADPVLPTGPTGSGQLVKLINNALFAAQLGLVADAVALGGQCGVAESVLMTALPRGSAASRALSGAAARGSIGAFATSVREFVGKDVDVVRAVAGELGGDLGALAPALDRLAAAFGGETETQKVTGEQQ